MKMQIWSKNPVSYSRHAGWDPLNIWQEGECESIHDELMETANTKD